MRDECRIRLARQLVKPALLAVAVVAAIICNVYANGFGSSRSYADAFGSGTKTYSDGRTERSWTDPSGATTTFYPDGTTSRSYTDALGRGTKVYSDGRIERSSTDRSGVTTTFYPGGTTSRSYTDALGRGTKTYSDGRIERSWTDRSGATTTFYSGGTTRSQVGAYDTDQPISFHTGAFPQQGQGNFESQRRIWEQNAMRKMMETWPRRTYEDEQRDAEEKLRRELQDSPIVRQMYNEYMRKVGEQFAQQCYNTFGAPSDESGSCPPQGSRESQSYFKWFLLIAAIVALCKWMCGNRHELKKREFWAARGAWALLLGKKSVVKMKRSVCWTWNNRHELKKREFLSTRGAWAQLQNNKSFAKTKVCMCWVWLRRTVGACARFVPRGAFYLLSIPTRIINVFFGRKCDIVRDAQGKLVSVKMPKSIIIPLIVTYIICALPGVLALCNRTDSRTDILLLAIVCSIAMIIPICLNFGKVFAHRVVIFLCVCVIIAVVVFVAHMEEVEGWGTWTVFGVMIAIPIVLIAMLLLPQSSEWLLAKKELSIEASRMRTEAFKRIYHRTISSGAFAFVGKWYIWIAFVLIAICFVVIYKGLFSPIERHSAISMGTNECKRVTAVSRVSAGLK